MRAEGLRTRDGHLLEWFCRHRPQAVVSVHSRPEPWPRLTLARRSDVHLPEGLRLLSPQPLVVPSPRDRRRWWISSLRYRVPWADRGPAVVWNPFEAAAAIVRHEVAGPLIFDLLDDWSVHRAFTSIRTELEDAYRAVFARADYVTANSEGTLALARRFGRADAELLANGVDPDRFALPPTPTGRFTVGYGGKIGFRLDTEIVLATARALPDVDFEFAGPILDREVGRELKVAPNVRLLGDVRYDRYPQVLRRWDVAWAPHRLGEHEVGGDLIKLYEYRAAGLPTFSTKVIGWERAVAGVRAIDSDRFVEAVVDYVRTTAHPVPREPIDLPASLTWSAKARRLLTLMEVVPAQVDD